MSVKGAKFITPLADTVLDRALGNVLLSFFTNEPQKAWDGLKTLLDIIPDQEIRKKIKPKIEEVETRLRILNSKRGYTQSDSLNREHQINAYLNQKKHEILEELTALLKAGGYWDRIVGPRYETPKKPLSVNEK